jgi:HAD superfamily hydrolase (TIGR01509 family)
MIEALLWDVDGTLADTEQQGHRVAYNQAFAQLGLDWRWDEAGYAELLRVRGGRRRLLAFMAGRSDAPPEAERAALAWRLHALKTDRYAELVAAGAVALRPGVRELVDEAAARGLRQAIVSSTRRANVEALLRHHFGASWGRLFGVVVSGEDGVARKPEPDGHLSALAQLSLAPLAALALEDSFAGARAARLALVPVVVTRSAAAADEPIDEAVAVGPGLHTRDGWRPSPSPERAAAGRITLDDLADWRARMDLVSHFG